MWAHLVNGTGNSPSPGRPIPRVVKQDKSPGGSTDTTKTRSDPQRVRTCSGEKPIGAAKGKQPNTMASRQPPRPPPSSGPPGSTAIQREWEKTKFTEGQISLGHFQYTNFCPPPPPHTTPFKHSPPGGVHGSAVSLNTPTQTAHPATSSTAPAHQPLGSARHQWEHWPQRLTELSDPRQHAKGIEVVVPPSYMGMGTLCNAKRGVVYGPGMCLSTGWGGGLVEPPPRPNHPPKTKNNFENFPPGKNDMRGFLPVVSASFSAFAVV